VGVVSFTLLPTALSNHIRDLLLSMVIAELCDAVISPSLDVTVVAQKVHLHE